MQQNQTVWDGLLWTKLHAPGWDGVGVHRLDLIDRICSVDTQSLLSIVAAAGSGKSTIMSQFLHRVAEKGFSTAWVSLESEDNDPSAFSAYLSAALSQMADQTPGHSGALRLDSAAGDAELLFEVMLSRMTTLPFPAALFFDDFQHINNPVILRFIDRLIARAPDNLKLVIASRNQLPLELGRLRVAGRLCEIEQDELNFGAPEATHFLRESHGIELKLSDLTRLMEATEGWVAGLQLAALALRRSKGNESELIAAFSGRDRDLMSYLGETVLQAQPVSVRRFLLDTAPLRRMCPELCEAVSEHPKCGEMLSLLDQQKLFLIALDRSGNWYRYHHLFGDFLQKLVLDSEPERHRKVCEKAARWCETQGLITEAIQYSLDAGQFERAADMIADHGIRAAVHAGDHYTVLDWMRRLPSQFQMLRPEIKLCHAFSLAFSRQVELPFKLATQVEEELDKQGEEALWKLDSDRRNMLRSLSQVIQAIAAGSNDDLGRCHDLGLPLTEGKGGINPAISGSAAACVAYGSLANGDLSKAVKYADTAVRDGQDANAGYVSVWGHFLFGIAELDRGRVLSASQHGEYASALADRVHERKSFIATMAALLNAEVASCRGDFHQARQLMETGRLFALLFGPVEPLICAFRNDARITAWLGDLPGALNRLEEGREIAKRSSYRRLHVALSIEEALLLLINQRPSDAIAAVKRSRLREMVEEMGVAQGANAMRNALKLLDVRLALATGRSEEALEAATRLQYAVGANCPGNLLMRIRSVKASVLWELEREAEAMRELDRALTAAAEQSCLYPVLTAGRALRPILINIRDHRAGEETGVDTDKARLIHSLLSVLDGGRIATPGDAAITPTTEEIEPPAEVLTTREIEILRMAGSGLTNKRLAKALLITEATVKWHMHNIYGKLSVGNRTAAVTRARELMLL